MLPGLTLLLLATLPANVAVDPVKPIRFGDHNIVLESTTLAQVRRLAGGGTIQRRGDGGESLHWLCYTVAHARSVDVLWLSSDEMGGGEAIDGFLALRLPELTPAYQDCTPLPANEFPMSLSNGLWLGTAESQVLHVYGKPHVDGPNWKYAYQARSGDYEVVSEASFKIGEGEVVGIALSRVTSN